MTETRVEIKQHIGGGYVVWVDGVFVAFCLTRWGARWAARRIRARIDRGVYVERF